MSEDLFRAFEDQMGEIDFGGVEDISALKDMALILRLEEVDSALYQVQELMHPRTQAGRDLHSVRAAVVVEIKKRGLM